MRESDPRFSNLERRVGVFLTVSALLVIGAIAVVGVRHGLFTPKTPLVFYAHSGDGLAEGMEVVTRGFRIGQVKSVRLDDTGQVEVRLAIDTDQLRWIRRDSVARLAAKALIGDSRVEISPGSPEAPEATDGQVIAFVHEPDLIDIAKALAEKDVKPVLQGIRNLVAYLEDPQGDLRQTIAGLNRLSAGMNQTLAPLGERLNALAENLEALSASLRRETLPQVTGLLGQGQSILGDTGRTVRSLETLVREDLHALAATVNGEVAPQLRALIATANRATASAGGGADALGRELPAILAKIDATLENLRVITERLAPAAQELPGVLRQGGELVEDSQELVRSIQGTWPFRPEEKPPGTAIDVDSYQIRNAPPPGPAADPRAR